MKNTAIILMLSLASCYASDEAIADQDHWLYRPPSAYGFDEAGLLGLNEAIVERDFGNIQDIIMLKDKHVLFEKHYSGTRSSLRNADMLTNTITILLLDEFITAGRISREDPIAKYLPEYAQFFNEDEEKKLITIGHLLDHASGISWNEALVNHRNIRSDIYRIQRSEDWIAYMLTDPLLAAPGSLNQLNSASGLIYIKVLEHLLKGENVLSYIERRLFNPLGITDYQWDLTPDGSLNGMNGLHLSAFDLTKIAYVVLHEGRWTDRRRIIDRQWTLEVIKSITPGTTLGKGWLVFRSPDRFSSYIPEQDYPVIAAMGGRGQALYLWPKENLVITIAANNSFFPYIYGPSPTIASEMIGNLKLHTD